MTPTSPEVAESLRDLMCRIAEYAKFPEHLEIAASPAAVPDQCEVQFGKTTYTVCASWCMGNLNRLHDHCSVQQMHDALYLSHPDRKGVSSKQLAR